MQSYRGMHNNDMGPGQYQLPPLVAVEKKALSSMKNSPRLSIGLPRYKNKPYWPEVKNDFMGKDSPAVTSYQPDADKIKTSDPKYS